LRWDLWLGTAKNVNYIDNLVPFNWRGWWDFGTGALGDMGCHIIGPPFKLLELGYPTEVSGSASTVYNGIFKEEFIQKVDLFRVR
jgi:predicted dehydrogenase